MSPLNLNSSNSSWDGGGRERASSSSGGMAGGGSSVFRGLLRQPRRSVDRTIALDRAAVATKEGRGIARRLGISDILMSDGMGDAHEGYVPQAILRERYDDETCNGQIKLWASGERNTITFVSLLALPNSG